MFHHTNFETSALNDCEITLNTTSVKKTSVITSITMPQISICFTIHALWLDILEIVYFETGAPNEPQVTLNATRCKVH